MSGAQTAAIGDPAPAYGFWQATLDSLTESLVVLNHLGDIVAVNQAWRDFAEANGGDDVGVAANYLAVCDRSAETDPIAAEVAMALRAVADGTRPEYRCTYPCHAPSRERWYSMRIARFQGTASRRIVITHQDITEQHTAQRRSHEQAELLDAVGAAIIATDLKGTITHWSDGAQRLYGWASAEVLGLPVQSLVAPIAAAGLLEEARRAVLVEGRWAGQLDVCRKDGTRFPVNANSQLLHDAEGRAIGQVGVSVDITERVHMEASLRGARDFLATVTRTMPDGLMVIDEDGRLTLVNEAAEALLGWPAEELVGELKHEKIHSIRTDGTFMPAQECPIAIAREAGTTVRIDDDVFQRRDGSLLPVAYSAAPFRTENGERGSVVVFSDITEEKAREQRVRLELETMSWVGRIRDALDQDRLVVYAQPIVEIASGRTIQHELLVRMVSPEGEVISPNSFLPIAEKHGLIGAIDRRVFELALVHAEAGHPVEVNLSAESISDPALFRFVEDRLRVHDVDPRLVVFEITETALIHNEAVAQAFIENVRRLNCGVALDDFGTGYGSFRYLKHLPVTMLKIDQEFVRDLDGPASATNLHVVEAIVTLARGMGQKTVAEGVETASALDILRDLRVDYAQGYHIAHPAPADEVFRTVSKEA